MPFQPADRLPRLVIPVLLILLLASCGVGGNNDPDPTVTPQPTATTEVLAPGQLSVGQLIDGMATAYGTIGNARTVFVTSSTSGTPTMSPMTTETWIAPDRRQIVTAVGDQVVDDQIAIGGTVYMRGSFVTSAVAPMIGTDTWVTVDPALVPADTPVGNVVAYLTAPFRLPFANLSDSMRGRGVTAVGQETIAGRACTAYTFVDTTSTGDRIDYRLAIDERGLPCSLTEQVGAIVNTTTFEFDIPDLRIVAPDSATPVSGTPEG
jgi:hypothetical protein